MNATVRLYNVRDKIFNSISLTRPPSKDADILHACYTTINEFHALFLRSDYEAWEYYVHRLIHQVLYWYSNKVEYIKPKELQDILSECSKIMRKKNHDYATSANPYKNFDKSEIIGIHPVSGILLRIMDKISRFETFSEKGRLMVEKEGVKDSLYDIINYSVILLGYLNEQAL